MRLSCFLRGVLFSSVALLVTQALATNNDPTSFAETAWQQSTLLTQITNLAWAPDGSHRLFATRKSGSVAIIKDGAILTSGAALDPWVSLTPYTSSECGLLGIAFHPNFVVNHYVYLFVTVSASEQQILRYIDNPTTNKGTFDKIVVAGLPTKGINHDGGALGFGRDGYLYWAIGDQGSPRTGINADLTVLAAKVGRATDEGAVPLDNPFYDAAGPNNDYIWARGFRNPFTMTFRPSTGELWLDVVGSLWEQIFVVPRGGHGGWDALENNQPPGYLAPVIAYRTNGQNQRTVVSAVRSANVVTVTTSAAHQYRRGAIVQMAGQADASFTGSYAITAVPSETTFTFAQTAADGSTSGGTSTQLPMGGAVGGGTFYASTLFPSEYWGNFFFGDYNSGQYFRVTLDGAGVSGVREWANYGVALDTAVGPDGALYASTFAFGGEGVIYRTVPTVLPTGPVVTPTELWVKEGGRAAFDVVLPSKPGSAVMLSVTRTSGDADLSVIEGATLVFNPSNWDQPQRVVILSTADADRVDDTAVFSVEGGGLPTRTVNAYVSDAPPAIYAYASPLGVVEGGSATLSVGLSEPATSTVTVNVAVSGDPDVTAPVTLTFEPSDGTNPKTLTVSAAADADGANDLATVSLSAVGHTGRDVPVVVTDVNVTAPAFTSTPPSTTIVNRPLTYDANAVGTPTPTYALVNPPSGATIDATTGVLSYTPSSVGIVNFQIVASNSQGQATQSFAVNVVADGAPTAVLTRPVAAEVVSGTNAEFFGDCMDDVGCTKAEFYVDDVLLYTDLNNGNHYHLGGSHQMWDTTALSDGVHVAKIVVYDTAGQTGTASATFSVANGAVDLATSDAATDAAPGDLGTGENDLLAATDDLATELVDAAGQLEDLSRGGDAAVAPADLASTDLAAAKSGYLQLAGGGCACRAGGGMGGEEAWGGLLLAGGVLLALRVRRRSPRPRLPA